MTLDVLALSNFLGYTSTVTYQMVTWSSGNTKENPLKETFVS